MRSEGLRLPREQIALPTCTTYYTYYLYIILFIINKLHRSNSRIKSTLVVPLMVLGPSLCAR